MKKIALLAVALPMTIASIAQTKFWVYKDDGNTAEFEIAHTDSISFTDPSIPVPAGEKCKASDYPQVTIGDQIWMAENYRCSIYDTESEAYKEGRRIIPASSEGVYTPYYTDAADKGLWSSTEYAGNLTDEQVARLGYLYNWAAAVGLADGEEQTTPFEGRRQGICPNGWHIPTRAEWQMFQDYIEETAGRDSAGKHLKTTSGWFGGGGGEDTYGFSGLPAGSAYGSSVYNVGYDTYFWTAIPRESSSDLAYDRYLICNDDRLNANEGNKNDGQSVRCLKN